MRDRHRCVERQQNWLFRPAAQTAWALAKFMRRRVPVWFGRRIVSAGGTDGFEAIVMGDCDADWKPVVSTTTYQADVFGIAYGLPASTELALQTVCRTLWSVSKGGWITE